MIARRPIHALHKFVIDRLVVGKIIITLGNVLIARILKDNAFATLNLSLWQNQADEPAKITFDQQ